MVKFCKTKSEFKPKQHLPKDQESLTTLRAMARGPRKPWTDQDGKDKVLTARLSQPTWSPESLHHTHFQSFAMDFSRSSAQVSDGQPGTFLFVSSRSLVWNKPWVRASQPGPRHVRNCSENNVTPLLPKPSGLLGPGRNGVKLLWKRSWSFSISSYESPRSCRGN